jgi:predicted small secreted protein
MPATAHTEEKVMKRVLVLASALALSLQLTACNTMSGVGKDLQKAGEKIEEAAKKK